MGKAHSLDIRTRVVGMVEGGQSCRAAAPPFGVPLAVKRQRQPLPPGSWTAAAGWF